MDARTFTTYLNGVLKKKAQEFEGNLLSAHFETIADAKRVSGIRDTLIGIADSLDSVLADFYNKNTQTTSSIFHQPQTEVSGRGTSIEQDNNG